MDRRGHLLGAGKERPMKNSEDHREQDLDLTYKVRVRTHGKPSKHVEDIGQTIAQVLGLNFTDVEVTRGKRTYKRVTNGFVDAGTYDGVVSIP